MNSSASWTEYGTDEGAAIVFCCQARGELRKGCGSSRHTHAIVTGDPTRAQVYATLALADAVRNLLKLRGSW